jgi:hypothetical protein
MTGTTTTNTTTNFMTEARWINETITTMRTWQENDWAVGLSFSTGQPDGWCTTFAQRNLPLSCFITGSSEIADIGTPDAHEHNISTLASYFETLRSEEVSAVQTAIREIDYCKSRGWSCGLSWPDGQPDKFTQFFCTRNLPISFFVQGQVSAGSTSAYDENINTLLDYLGKVAETNLG